MTLIEPELTQRATFHLLSLAEVEEVFRSLTFSKVEVQKYPQQNLLKAALRQQNGST